MFAGLVAPHFFDFNTLYFHESMWFVLPGYPGWGRKLYERAECECKRRGVLKMVMAHTHAYKPKQFEKMYYKLGFNKLETHYVKEI